MSKYENAIKLMEEFCGNGKDNLIALATTSLLLLASTPSPSKTYPKSRIVQSCICSYCMPLGQ